MTLSGPATAPVQRRPTADLIARASNPKIHQPKQVDQIAASIREWGWTIPVLIDENNTIIAGHGRYPVGT